MTICNSTPELLEERALLLFSQNVDDEQLDIISGIVEASICNYLYLYSD